ncbi:hypothetical protein A3K34_01415 [candidate division WWE3 bacterium RIFOXYC1_FULL_40_10]|uniref:Large ribosomal subunit protein bL35 n=1 Tax=candidate division WWE3 bacterium RIFOXYA2_FULL_46_9 TaxID=1802636 RepID=A0A1F4W2D7_UNCKA|nr:MAG: hypothetical protein A3K58_01415 [candidate division WWE3 bacterium RIFOXYB1_FULL_40_22]OGC61528.1 MAG: hypothetical protein A3K37_01415 [candidate division WWE3 bacterium RIFOXYA1_FULL_40_11]OGC63576.1 MAG: hypothetical protein A2264_04355 [candidate division WWE3 bacterium RIFOXYA2_FULL_46_9]OGC64793.1 MAG: hypothetical protein A2326_02040 [candidate division WWE3 bacterium RIFOXYB2_FULL_41_6]OGC65911.1 MAG: hypothetical protein A3K34_01415 [candidate division WWE3 bacterium RIFOXYC1_
MPKMKTKKTLTKRIRVTKNGKLMKKQSRTGHLKRKMDSSRKYRKRKTVIQENKGHIRILRKLLNKFA